MSLPAFDLKVVTPDGPVWEGKAVSVVVPGLDGYFGVWKGHMPLISALDVGSLMVRRPDERQITYIAVDGGFVEVNRDSVTVLAESAAMATDIDLTRTGAAEQRVREELNGFFPDSISREQAENELKAALNRKRTAELARTKPTELF
jgi:F-type H+-transporting ATPase subunit epsilon